MKLYPHTHKIGRAERNSLNGHGSMVVWFTGLSGSGKSTLSNLLEQRLHSKGLHTYVLDGDNIRGGLNKDLDFTEAGRTENIRRIGEVARMFADAGIIVIAAFISPYDKDRKLAKTLIGPELFIEVYLDCPVEVCEQRDVKQLYSMARAGQLKNFTGIDAPYEIPQKPDVVLRTGEMSTELSVDLLYDAIMARLFINKEKAAHEG
jgi:adenylylsulfate kinase